MTLASVLRIGAIAIAVAGIIDPAVTLNGRVKPTVSVVNTSFTDNRDGSLASRVSRLLEDRFEVVRQPLPGAAAVVVVGDRPPAGEPGNAPTFAVIADEPPAGVAIASVSAPSRALFDSRVNVTVRLRTWGARGHRVEMALAAGHLVVDHATRDIAGDDERIEVPLAFVPAAEGAAALRVTAHLAEVAGSDAVADLGVNVERRQWSVLVVDRHPSWASTFVRRALERDARFTVATRIDTSTNFATSVGQPPVSLSNLGDLSRFDAIVAGGADSLSAGDVAGLEAFARRRGGTVIVLLEHAPAGPLLALTGRAHWTEVTQSAPVDVDAMAPAAERLRASELAWPDVLPPGAESLAVATVGRASRAIVWQMPVGAGRVIVSGALDSWRTRATGPAFDEYWRAVVADAADAAPRPLLVTLDGNVAAPNTAIGVTVVERGSASKATLVARLEGPDGSSAIRLWPTPEPGRWHGTLQTSTRAGAYRLTVSSGPLADSTSFVVAESVVPIASDGRDALRAWAASGGGTAIGATDAGSIADVVARAVPATSTRQTRRPLRSLWWIMPFALLLGGEWWLRRRRGLP